MSGQARSRAGCKRCRRRRQKCDEARPSCARCHIAGVDCDYEVNIRWGGREFSRSRFQHCEVQKSRTDAGGFVYLLQRQPLVDTQSTGAASSTETPLQEQISIASSLFPYLHKNHRDLIHYFTNRASGMISSHMNFRSETCHVLFPLAAASSAVLHSILAFAAAHRAAHITTDVESRRLSFQAASLQTKSIHDLQAEVMAVKQPAAVLATSLMLCLGVLCHGGGDYSSWRIYLLGAKASLYALCGSKSTSNMDQIPVNYLKRRYELLETIAMLSPGGFPAIDTARLETQTYQTEVFLDDHSACYTDVLNILRQIGVAILDKFGMQHDRQTSLPSTDNYTVTADELEAKVCQMIARDQNTAPVFRPGIFETMNATLAKDFAICNKIYEYTALLLIRVRLRQKRLDSLEVVAVIKNIIHLGRLIEPRTVLSPGLGLNTAFHTAGTYALDEDRRDIKELLLSFYQKTRSYSMKLALFHLDAERSERATVENTAISDDQGLDGYIPY